MKLLREIKLLKGNTKGVIFIICFRLTSFFLKNRTLKVVGYPIMIAYRIIFPWILGIDVAAKTKIGIGFNVYHGQGLVINSDTLIGENVTVRQNTTIGSAKSNGKSPVLEDRVDVGANAVIIGEIIIGEGSIIAAGSVVVHNVPRNVLVAGNPAKIIRNLKNE